MTTMSDGFGERLLRLEEDATGQGTLLAGLSTEVQGLKEAMGGLRDGIRQVQLAVEKGRERNWAPVISLGSLCVTITLALAGLVGYSITQPMDQQVGYHARQLQELQDKAQRDHDEIIRLNERWELWQRGSLNPVKGN